MIGAKELAMVKPTVRIINTARGGLIDEEALAKAVKEKRVAGAAIDVFPTEPCTQSVLFEDDKIIVTPHLGASTTEAQALAATDVAEQVVDILQGTAAPLRRQRPLHPLGDPVGAGALYQGGGDAGQAGQPAGRGADERHPD